ncbi:MAG: hypothetical protein HPY59_03710 [Anaerolineae bacterium]|nr:hypothetical protein [Anaerolineae bacterium]
MQPIPRPLLTSPGVAPNPIKQNRSFISIIFFMIERTLAAKMISLAQKFQVITLIGPRQPGKTTLVRAVFLDLP